MTTSVVAEATFNNPTIEYGSIYPILIVFAAACLGVVFEAVVPRAYRYVVQVALSLGSLIVALIGTILIASDLDPVGGSDSARGLIAVEGALAVDGPTIFIWGVLLALSIISVMLMAE